MWSQLTVKYNVRADLHCFIHVIRLPFANVLAFIFIVYFLHFYLKQKDRNVHETIVARTEEYQNGQKGKAIIARAYDY